MFSSGSLPPLHVRGSSFSTSRGKCPFYCCKHHHSSVHLIPNLKTPCVQDERLLFCCKNQACCLVFFPSSSIAGLEGAEVVHQEFGIFIKLYGGPKLKQERSQVGITRNFATLRTVEQVKWRSCDQIKPQVTWSDPRAGPA